jgi:MFS family permease
MPVYGRLGDLVGRKPLFLAAIALFLLGSVVGGAAGSVEWLVALLPDRPLRSTLAPAPSPTS